MKNYVLASALLSAAVSACQSPSEPAATPGVAATVAATSAAPDSMRLITPFIPAGYRVQATLAGDLNRDA